MKTRYNKEEQHLMKMQVLLTLYDLGFKRKYNKTGLFRAKDIQLRCGIDGRYIGRTILPPYLKQGYIDVYKPRSADGAVYKLRCTQHEFLDELNNIGIDTTTGGM